MSQAHPTTGETPEEVKNRLDDALEQEIQKDRKQTNKAVEALAQESIQKTSETVELTNGMTVKVGTSLPPELESAAGELDSAESVEDSLDVTSRIMAYLVLEDELSDPQDWQDFYELVGTSLYWDNLYRITEPYFQANLDKQEESKRRQDAVDGFRNK